MHDLTLTYQTLIEAVFAATGARGTVYPNDYTYTAPPISMVRAVLGSFDPGPWMEEADDCDDKARRLWYAFKERSTLSACGIVRLKSPVPHDIVGIVTAEDLLAVGSAAREKPVPAGRDMLGDEISEIDEGHYSPPGVLRLERPSRRKVREMRDVRGVTRSEEPSVEMTLIEPQTKQVFKRSHGGVFGAGGWPVSGIRAFAVWF